MNGHDADLLAVRADEANLGHTNTIIDAGLGADGTSKGLPLECSTVWKKRQKTPHVTHAGPLSPKTLNVILDPSASRPIRWEEDLRLRVQLVCQTDRFTTLP
ncbi:hypothetical protein GCM10009555_048690 [Acrocarpospora macrocephala]|uniref:Uncharacterized protein n=1 Tax=Acrocarpospora macrocephala TaxID=150177 RepID=A0A5M3X0V9_9ACTN|nr:hypothetical protein Amac_082270 [Acrocarpospora macrocephala]